MLKPAVYFSPFPCFAGPLIASLLAIIFNWKLTFIVSGLIAVLIGIAVYTVFTILENKKIITLGEKKKALGIKSVFEFFKLERFVFFMFIGGLVEISASSIGFWIPTFFTDKLGYSKETANILFSAITVIKAVAPFLTLAVLKLSKDDELKMINVKQLMYKKSGIVEPLLVQQCRFLLYTYLYHVILFIKYYSHFE